MAALAQGGQQSFQEASQDGKISFRNAVTLKNTAGGRCGHGPFYADGLSSMKTTSNGATFKISYGSKLHVKDKAKIKRGDKLYEWDPYTLPIIAEKGGYCEVR